MRRSREERLEGLVGRTNEVGGMGGTSGGGRYERRVEDLRRGWEVSEGYGRHESGIGGM